MSHKSDTVRLESILMYIDDINEIIRKHTGVKETLADKEGQYAVMMCLVQIGETLGRIESPGLRDKLPVKLGSSLRNIIVHDYEGVDPKIVGLTISESLPKLKAQILEVNR
jgi:uncharacterized protein with HEPN domain